MGYTGSMIRCLDRGMPHGSHSAGLLTAAALAAASWSICMYCGADLMNPPHVLDVVSETVTSESQTSEQKQALRDVFLCAAAGRRRPTRSAGAILRRALLLEAGMGSAKCVLIMVGCASSFDLKAGRGCPAPLLVHVISEKGHAYASTVTQRPIRSFVATTIHSVRSFVWSLRNPHEHARLETLFTVHHGIQRESSIETCRCVRVHLARGGLAWRTVSGAAGGGLVKPQAVPRGWWARAP